MTINYLTTNDIVVLGITNDDLQGIMHQLWAEYHKIGINGICMKNTDVIAGYKGDEIIPEGMIYIPIENYRKGMLELYNRTKKRRMISRNGFYLW